MIYARTMQRELWNFFVFEDISELSIFEGDRSSSSSGGWRYGFSRNVVTRGKIGTEVNRGSEGFLVASDVGNHEKKELIALRVDSSGRKDFRETTLRMEIRKISGFDGLDVDGGVGDRRFRDRFH